MTPLHRALRLAAGLLGVAFGVATMQIPTACAPCDSPPFRPNGTFAVVDPEEFQWSSGELELTDEAVELVYVLDDGSQWKVSWRIAPPP